MVQIATGMEKEEEDELHIANVIKQSNANPMGEVEHIPAPETQSVEKEKVRSLTAALRTPPDSTGFALRGGYWEEAQAHFGGAVGRPANASPPIQSSLLRAAGTICGTDIYL